MKGRYSSALRRASVRDRVRTPAGKLPPFGSCHQATGPSTVCFLRSEWVKVLDIFSGAWRLYEPSISPDQMV
jgi:hypothetical protein